MDITAISKIVLTAEDKTAAGFDSATSRARKTGDELDRITRLYGAQAAAAIKAGMDAERAFNGELAAMQRTRAEITNMQRQLDTLGGGNRDIARAILGTRSSLEISNEIRLITSALDQLKRSANIGPNELARASEAAAQKLAVLRAELSGIPPQVNAIGGAAGALPGILRGVLGPLVALASFEGIRRLVGEFGSLADANTLLQARLKAVTGSAEDGRRAFAGLVEDARRLRVPIEEAGQGFVRISLAVRELGGSVEQARKLNEILLATAKVSGASAQEAAAAARQFAQALGSGVLQGDELRSILENNQELARQLAAGLGVSVGELRKLGAEGKLTADVVANALLERLPEIQGKLRDVPITVADAFALLKNEVFLFVGAVDQGAGASTRFATNMSKMADGLRLIRQEFADGNIISGLTALGQLTTGRLDDVSDAARFRASADRFKDSGLDARDLALQSANEKVEQSALGVSLAAKRAYDDAIKVGDEFLSKQQKITQQFGANMQTIAKAIDATRRQIDSTPAGSNERAAAEEHMTQLLKFRAQAETDVVKKLGEANAADSKRSGTLKEITANQKAYNSVLEQVTNIAQGAQEALDQVFLQDNFTKAEQALRKLENSEAWSKLTEDQRAYLRESLLVAAATERLTASLKEAEKAAFGVAKDRAREYAEWETEVRKAAESVDTLVEKLNTQAQALRSGGVETNEQAQALRKLKDDLDNGLIPSMEEYERRVHAVNDAFANRDSAQAWVDAQKNAIAQQKKDYEDLYRSIDDLTSQLWAAVTDKGGSAFEKITQVLKNTLLATLYKMAVQPFVVSIIAQVTGQGAGGIVGGGGALGSLLNGGIGGLGNLFSNAGSTISNFFADLDHGVGVIDSFTTALSTGGASLLGVVGILGTVASVAYSIFANKGGGPKSGGFASAGDISGITNVDSTGRYFTPSGADPDLSKTVDAIKTGYLEAVKALGLTAGNVGFALGFDTDPQGTAPNRVHSSAFLGGRPIYDAPLGDLGRDEAVLKEALALEAKRILFAAIQASMGDAPEYIAKLFEGIDAATASAEQIDNILATAQALKIVVDAVSGMGEKFAAMDPEQITALVEAFGGLQAFLESASFISSNFTTDAERAAQATQLLNDSFAALGVSVPSTHQAFTDLLASLDLTTEEGRASYAAISRLAPLFVSVYGTAQQAAEETATATAQLTAEEQKLTDARRDAIDAAKDFFNANFYSQQEQAATALQANWEIVHNAWTAMGEQLLELGYTSIPTTNAAFRTMIETLRAQGLGDLADSLVLIAPAIFGINVAVGELTDAATEAGSGISDAVDTINKALERAQEMAGIARDAFGAIMSAIEDLIGQSGGDFGDKLGLRLVLIGEQIKKYEQLIAAEESGPNLYGPLIAEYKMALQKLKEANGQAAKELARFTILAAQYDAARAEQLVQLEEWYAGMQAALAGSTEALAALDVLFKQKWDDIVNGTSTGVSDTLDEFERLQQGIRDFLDSLKLGTLSPLTPAQKLAEAEAQYKDLLAKAQGGDLDAMSKITGAASAYLEIARQFYASSQAYTDIFNSVTAALETLATMDKPGTTQEATNAALIAVLPTNGNLVSSEDLKAGLATLAAEVATSLSAVVEAVNSSSAANEQAVGSQTQALQTTSEYK